VPRECTGASDDGCGKIWTVYTAEAEKHDKILKESWTQDMKGVLLFVGRSIVGPDPVSDAHTPRRPSFPPYSRHLLSRVIRH
jgi:hypothetical protein